MYVGLDLIGEHVISGQQPARDSQLIQSRRCSVQGVVAQLCTVGQQYEQQLCGDPQRSTPCTPARQPACCSLGPDRTVGYNLPKLPTAGSICSAAHAWCIASRSRCIASRSRCIASRSLCIAAHARSLCIAAHTRSRCSAAHARCIAAARYNPSGRRRACTTPCGYHRSWCLRARYSTRADRH